MVDKSGLYPTMLHSESALAGYFLMYGFAVYICTRICLLVSKLPAVNSVHLCMAQLDFNFRCFSNSHTDLEVAHFFFLYLTIANNANNITINNALPDIISSALLVFMPPKISRTHIQINTPRSTPPASRAKVRLLSDTVAISNIISTINSSISSNIFYTFSKTENQSCTFGFNISQFT